MNFLLIAVCLFAGWALRQSNTLPENSHRGINLWILYIALPSVTLLYVPEITWTASLILPLAMPLIVWGGAWLLTTFIGRRLAGDARTRAALLLTAGLGNTSFIGFPLTQAYFGDAGLRIAVICDQITFLVLSTLGVMTALNASNGNAAGRHIMIRNIIRFPSFIAFVAALILPPFVDLHAINPILEKFAVTLVPLALFSVGTQLRVSEWRDEVRPLAIGLIYKLVLAPSAIFAVALVFQARGVVAQSSMFEAAMPPMITSAIIATEYQLNAKLSNLMVSGGILLSLITTLLWWMVAQGLLS